MGTPIKFQTPRRFCVQDPNSSPDSKNQSETRAFLEFSALRLQHPGVHKKELSNLTCNSQIEHSNSVLESSEFAVVRPALRNPERVSTVVLTSESVLSRNKLQECSVHLERLIEYSNTLTHSKKFEDKLQVTELPGLHSPVFANNPTIAFCNRCGRDVKTKIQKLENRVLGLNLNDFFCCFPNISGKQEIVHCCSRCRHELVKITL